MWRRPRHRLINNIEVCENEIGNRCKGCNGVVKRYNSHRLTIPTIFIVRSMGFGEVPYLQFDQTGAAAPNSMKEFRTDDGERLQQLISGAGNSIAKTTRNMAQQAGRAGKMLAEKIKESPDAKYFHMSAGGAPKGPLPLDEYRPWSVPEHCLSMYGWRWPGRMIGSRCRISSRYPMGAPNDPGSTSGMPWSNTFITFAWLFCPLYGILLERRH